jgi:hypothetical protein
VLRTVVIGIAGAVLALVLVAAGVHVAAYFIPQRLDLLFYFALKAFVGLIVGFFVGSVQRSKAGIVAVACLLPLTFLQATSRTRPIRSASDIALLLLSEILAMSIGFVVAQHLSKARSATAKTAESH